MDKSSPFTHPPDDYVPLTKEERLAQLERDALHLMKSRDKARVALYRVSQGDPDCLVSCVEALKYLV